MAVPTKALLDRLAVILSTDTGSLAPAALALKVHLAQAAFVPGPGLALGGLTEATFVGYTALLAGVGAQQQFFDETTGNRIIQLNEPAGGWHWQATTAVGLPQTIFGFYVTDNATLTLWGAALIAPNVQILAAGDGVDLAQVRFGLVPGSLV